MVEIKQGFRFDKKTKIYSLSLDISFCHYSKHSKDKKLMESLNDIVKVLVLGIREELKK